MPILGVDFGGGIPTTSGEAKKGEYKRVIFEHFSGRRRVRVQKRGQKWSKIGVFAKNLSLFRSFGESHW